MEPGKVYVGYNAWIRVPDKNNMPYKIGITKNTFNDRYSGIGLKMPGEFRCEFEYEFSENYDKIEKALHRILNQSNVNGEWFDINEKTLSGIQSMLELLGGKLVAEDVDVPMPGDEPRVVITRDDWNKKYPQSVDTAECLRELLNVIIEKLNVEYKQKNIAFTSATLPTSRNLYLYLTRKEEPNECLLAFRVKEDAREELRELLEKNKIEHTLIGERKVVISPINRQIIEQHKDVFIKITESVKKYKEQ